MSGTGKIKWLAVCLTMVLASCRQEVPVASGIGTGGSVLSAYKERVQSRAASEEYFAEGTKYRIWVTPSEFPADGMVGTETVRKEDNTHYIDLGNYNDKLTGEVDFYGLTDGTNKDEDISPGKVDSAYSIALQSNGDYIDYRRGQLLSKEHEAISGVLRMPFKHIMAQVKLEVMREESVRDLELVSVEFIGKGAGVTTAGNYNVKENSFTSTETSTREVFPKDNKPLEVPEVGSGTTDAALIRKVLVFPEEQSEPLHYLRVTFNDPDNFYDKGTSEVQINIPIYDNRETSAVPLHFVQNTSYTLCISFLSDKARIVTLVPQMYDWIDGETENEDEDGGFQEQDLGQPITFNGVMWSDRNLGATSAHPIRSIEDWYESVGYFYEYGRDIPFFPNSLNPDGTVNLKTPLNEALSTGRDEHGTRNLYPVVNFESWGHGLTAQNQKDKIAPVNGGKKCIWQQGYYDKELAYYWGYSFVWDYHPYWLTNYDYGWENNTRTPCPPGWRLPTVADYKGITPGSGYAGNITFRKFTGIDGGGSWQADPEASEPDFENIYSKANIGNYKGVPELGVDGDKSVYKGFFPCIFREEQDDPTPGKKSQYVLSMMNEEGFQDWNRARDGFGELGDNTYIYNWGVIYGIKNQGSPAAYRVKWEVKLLSEEAPTPGTDNNGKPYLNYTTPFRGVLVISRYRASSTDAFVADTNGSYVSAVKQFDWDHPVEVMYLPVGGYADFYTKGKVANIGTELWYAISDRPGDWDNPEEQYKNIFWFKFAGRTAHSQTMIISDKSRLSASVQIRCVRDLTNK